MMQLPHRQLFCLETLKQAQDQKKNNPLKHSRQCISAAICDSCEKPLLCNAKRFICSHCKNLTHLICSKLNNIKH